MPSPGPRLALGRRWMTSVDSWSPKTLESEVVAKTAKVTSLTKMTFQALQFRISTGLYGFLTGNYCAEIPPADLSLSQLNMESMTPTLASPLRGMRRSSMYIWRPLPLKWTNTCACPENKNNRPHLQKRFFAGNTPQDQVSSGSLTPIPRQSVGLPVPVPIFSFSCYFHMIHWNETTISSLSVPGCRSIATIGTKSKKRRQQYLDSSILPTV